MTCGECRFCKYDESIEEFVCSIEPDLPIVSKGSDISCKKAKIIVKNENE